MLIGIKKYLSTNAYLVGQIISLLIQKSLFLKEKVLIYPKDASHVEKIKKNVIIQIKKNIINPHIQDRLNPPLKIQVVVIYGSFEIFILII